MSYLAKSVTFADMAKTLKNLEANFRALKPASATSLGSRPTSISGGASLALSRLNLANSNAKGNRNSKKEDRYLFI